MTTRNRLGRLFARPARPARPARLLCQTLEGRDVPAVVVPPFPVTTMTQLAGLYPAHPGPTDLYLNFDGYADAAVAPFAAVSGNRTRDIHEVLFRVSELFAPFDVRVRRAYGNGTQAAAGGHSTVFIGDKVSNSTFLDTFLENRAYAYAPAGDRPSLSAGLHQPNSNPADRAYVDPVSWTASSANGWQIENYASWGTTQIARAVAHEAGHTFGLTHVLSNGVGEVMSYDAANSRFRNVSYPVTTLNYNGVTTAENPGSQPVWVWDPPGPAPVLPSVITHQNAYSYLQTALGARPADNANVADTTAVDGTYANGPMPALAGNGGAAVGSVGRAGDFDVYTTSTGSTRWLRVDVERIGDVDPVVLVLNGNGQQVLAFDDDGGPGLESRVVFQALAGQVYKLAVGSYGGTSTGSYRVTVNHHTFAVNPAVGDLPGGLAVPSPGKAGAQAPLSLSAGPPATVAEPAGGEAVAAPPAAVAAGAIGLAGDALVIRGTPGNDAADVCYVVAPGGAVSAAPTAWVRATLSTPLGASVAWFPTPAVGRVEFTGYAGNDLYTESILVRSTADGGPGNDVIVTGAGNDIHSGGPGGDLIFGGAGADYVTGDAGNDVLFGGTDDDHLIGDRVGQVGNDQLFGGDGNDALEGRGGNDVLEGGAGRDVLIGGFGLDALVGGPGDDLLVAGAINFPVLGAAVGAVHAEWTSPHAYAARVLNLRGTPHAGFGLRLNGGTFLQPGVTVVDDGVADVLTGGGGQDWFLIGAFDAIDLGVGEVFN